MAVQDLIEELRHLKTIIEDDSTNVSRCSSINELIGYEVPLEVCNILHSTKKNQSLGFMGLDPLSFDALLNQYQNRSEGYSFFATWGVDDNFDVKGYQHSGHTFFMEYDLNGELEKSVDINNVKSMIPIFEFEGNFILFNIDKTSVFYGLLYLTSEGAGSMLAPDLLSHVDDLLDGLNSEKYFVVQNEIVFPNLWHHRQQLKAGLIDMDEYGEILD